MLKTLLSLILFLPFISLSQTLIAYNNTESYNWSGSGWAVGSGNTDYPNNHSVSQSNSARLRGNGKGDSVYETGTYILSNRTNLNPTSTYILKFRVASYKISNPLAATAGVDVSDYFDLQYSINNGISYITEMRVTGNNNASWNYNTNGSIFKISSNSMTTYGPSGGSDRTNTGDGYSDISLVLPPNITQCAFRLLVRANGSGEEWWFDNFELWEESITTLPIELITFKGFKNEKTNILQWETATENNNDFFTLERSEDGDNWQLVTLVNGAGNSTEKNSYIYVDYNYRQDLINYYRLSQTDNDGKKEVFNTVSIDNRNFSNKILKTVNLMGQEVNNHSISSGLHINIYDDNTIEKLMR